MAQTRINAYMEKHRISAIFEDLMSKILRDMPEEPLVYLLRAMYKKTGMEIPQGIRYGGLRKSTSELYKSSSPEKKSRTAAVSSSTDAPMLRARTTSPTRMTKSRDENKSSNKQRPEWNPDNRVKSSFDDLWEESPAGRKEKAATKAPAPVKSNVKQSSASVNAWASVGLTEDGEEYSSPPYHGHKNLSQKTLGITEQELLASEKVPYSVRAEHKVEVSSVPASSSERHRHSRKLESQKHKQELGKLFSKEDKKLTDSGIGLDRFAQDDDDAIELLENADDLRREGVKNIPQAGYKLSKNIRYRENEPHVKLSINAYAYPRGNYGKYDTSETERSSPEQKFSEDEEEFESVSQVSGPRQPVWKVPDTDITTGEAIHLQPSYSPALPARTKNTQRNYTEKFLSATTPTQIVDRSVGSADDLTVATKTWTAGVVAPFDAETPRQSSRFNRPESSLSGWRLPDDVDLSSAYDWNQRVKSGNPRDPRAY